jgi:hypothetical protein
LLDIPTPSISFNKVDNILASTPLLPSVLLFLTTASTSSRNKIDGAAARAFVNT